MLLKEFPFYIQSHSMDCGPTCLKMITEYYGKHFDKGAMSGLPGIKKGGSSLFQLLNAAKAQGLSGEGLKIEVELLPSINLPVILHWDERHFVVLFEILDETYFIADPAIGLIRLSQSELLEYWCTQGAECDHTGILLKFNVTTQV